MNNQRNYFDEVYRSVYRDLLRYAIIHMNCPGDAEDALQNVFTAFYQRLMRFGHLDILIPKAYLMRMLKREIRRQNEARRREQLLEAPEEEADSLEREVPLEDIALDRSMTKTILDAARTLSPESYRTFVLYYGYGLSVAGIAQTLNVGQDAVKVRLYRARNTIRKRLLGEEKDK